MAQWLSIQCMAWIAAVVKVLAQELLHETGAAKKKKYIYTNEIPPFLSCPLLFFNLEETSLLNLVYIYVFMFYDLP